MTPTTVVPPGADDLEALLGDALDPGNPLGYQEVLAADEAGRLLPGGEKMLDSYGLNAQFVPRALGGQLVQADRLAHTLRPLFRRDCALGAGYGVTSFIAAASVWTSGSEEQRRWMADLLLGGGKVAAGYNELAHGNDLTRVELEATAAGDTLLLNGGKQVVNNLARAEAAILLARTDPAPGTRSHSHLLVDLRALPADRHAFLPRFRTAGIRGCQISGVSFTDCPVPVGSVVGAPGSAMETVLRAFQVSRALLPGLVIGCADTELRTTVAFTLDRRLYGRPIVELPHTRAVLADSFVDLLIADAFATTAARALHVLPAETSLYSAAAKYLVPKLLQETGANLAVLLGARSFLRDGPYGIFQKQLRDLPVATFGHAGGTVCLATLIPQLPQLSRRSWLVAEPADASLFRLGGELADLDFGALEVNARGADHLTAELSAGYRQFEHDGSEPELRALTALLLDELRELAQASAELPPRDRTVTAGPVGFELSERYAVLLAAASCLGIWRHNQDQGDPFLADPGWLIAALGRLAGRLGRDPAPRPAGLTERIVTELLARHREPQSFDLLRQRLSSRPA